MIANAKDIKLSEQSGTVPRVDIRSWLQTMIFIIVRKETINFRIGENRTRVKAQAIIIPFTDEELKIQPEGQRSWTWFKLYSDIFLKLNTGDKVLYGDREYQVMSRLDYSTYGYMDYTIVEGFQ